MPGLCGVAAFAQIARIVTSNDHPLVLPSASRRPGTSTSPTGTRTPAVEKQSTSSSGVPLLYVIVAGAGGVVGTGIVALFVWRYRRTRKFLRRKVRVCHCRHSVDSLSLYLGVVLV